MNGRIIQDPLDLRDLIYRPSLALLPQEFVCAALDPSLPQLQSLLRVRDQGQAPTCIGEALATVIDIQRIESLRAHADAEAARRDVKPASGAMLHAMAIEIESHEAGARVPDVYSLRAGLKGFYNAGVCTAQTWDQEIGSSGGALRFDAATVTVTREARNVTLGAYYRVRPIMNDWHAALVEAGALYVAAELHPGWHSDNLKKGVIDRSATGLGPSGGHAFAVVGYTPEGFLVLNSWGRDWGGYDKLAGVALWTYADWADHVMDCWALRLAVSTPESFRYTLGSHGRTDFGAGQPLAAPRRMEVLGRYVHLEDGRHVEKGTYASSRQSLDRTLEHLRGEGAKDVDAVRLTIHGDVADMDALMRRVRAAIPADKQARVHGLHVAWINTLLHGAAAALTPLFDAALAIAKGDRAAADRRIEAMTRPVGRALWRDVQRSAVRAARDVGDGFDALRSVVRLCKESGKPLHLVAEGAGAVLLAELLRQLSYNCDHRSELETTLASLTLVAPLISPKRYDQTMGAFAEAWAKRRPDSRATIFRADAVFEERLTVGAYSGSWTQLVAAAFEDEEGQLVGSPQFKGALKGGKGALKGDPVFRDLSPPPNRSGDLTAADLIGHAAVGKHLAALVNAGGPAPSSPNAQSRRKGRKP